MNRLGLVRLGWGMLQLLVPEVAAACVGAGSLDRRARRVVRVLGARHVVQALASGRHPSPPVLALGAGVDGLHAASMAALGVVDSSRYRPAFTSALIASGFALAGLLAARKPPTTRGHP